MTGSLFLIFAVGWLGAFLGTLPFGPINLSVVDTTLNKSFKAGLYISLAAAIVEIFQSLIAMHCSMLIGDLLSESIWTKIFVFFLFIGLGLLFFFRKEKAMPAEEAGKKKKTNGFLQGLLISLLNPQAIPFWIFVLTYVSSTQMIEITTAMPFTSIAVFLIGVSMGKFMALLLFGLLSRLIAKRSDALKKQMNKIIGSILILLGLFQGISVFLG